MRSIALATPFSWAIADATCLARARRRLAGGEKFGEARIGRKFGLPRRPPVTGDRVTFRPVARLRHQRRRDAANNGITVPLSSARRLLRDVATRVVHGTAKRAPENGEDETVARTVGPRGQGPWWQKRRPELQRVRFGLKLGRHVARKRHERHAERLGISVRQALRQQCDVVAGIAQAAAQRHHRPRIAFGAERQRDDAHCRTSGSEEQVDLFLRPRSLRGASSRPGRPSDRNPRRTRGRASTPLRAGSSLRGAR